MTVQLFGIEGCKEMKDAPIETLETKPAISVIFKNCILKGILLLCSLFGKIHRKFLIFHDIYKQKQRSKDVCNFIDSEINRNRQPSSRTQSKGCKVFRRHL